MDTVRQRGRRQFTARLGDGGRMFSALRYPQFRRFWFGNLAAVSGQQMMWVAQGWLVYRLTDSALYLGYVGLATAAPAVLLSLVGGVVADRFDQRRVVLLTQLVTAASVSWLAVLTASDLVQVWHVLVAAFIAGSMQAFNNPARQSIFPHLLDRKDLMNAVGLNSIVWQGTRIVAPATAGVIITLFGEATVFFLCAAGFLILGLVVAGLSVEKRTRRDSLTSPVRDLVEGIAFIRAHFLFAFLIGMSFFNSFFGFSTQQLMPVYAVDILNIGPDGLGMLFTVSGIGSIVGIAALAFARDVQQKGLLIVGGAVLYGCFIILFGISTSVPLSFAAIFLMGASSSIYMITLQTALQLRVPDELRGRVMGIYGVTYNIGPLGALQAGFIADRFGAPTAMVIGGLAIILFAAGVASSRAEVRGLRLTSGQATA
jgi:MFS family permease